VWSQDELYYGYLALGMSYVCLRRGSLTLAGALLGSTILFRASYLIPAAAVFGWFALEKTPSRRDVLHLGLGGAIAALVILVPFLIVGGNDFLARNAFTVAYEMARANVWPPGTPVLGPLRRLTESVSPWVVLVTKIGVVGAVLAFVTLRLRSTTDHPFWHVTVAGLLTYTVVWHPGQRGMDYALAVVLPAFMAIACTSREPPRAGE
jgi:hypothetical protein